MRLLLHRVMEEIEEVVGDKTTVEADDLDKQTYRIAGNFRGRKFSRMREIEHFANNIFANQRYCPIFVNINKTFADNIFANSL